MWWFNSSPKHLPEPSGPYLPGCMDVMTGYTEKGIFMRLYYPTEIKKNELSRTNYKKWITWIPDENYLQGIAKVLMLSVYLIKLIFWWSGNLRIPVLYGEKAKADKKLHCVLLSHGLGGCRFLYSHFCCELASRGFLVAALEHRDNSACYTYYYKSAEDARNRIRTPIEYKVVDLGKDHYKKRNHQVHLKAEECGKVLDFLSELNNGNVPYNVLIDVPTDRNIIFSLEDLVGKLDLDTVTMAGHSFGGATALLTLSKRQELKQGILLDPWMFPIKDENLEFKVKQPLLFLNTQTFHIATNVSAMEKLLLDESKRKMYTILHTTHENQTDTVLLIGYWLNWFMKKINPVTALKINHALVLTFLKDYVGYTDELKDCETLLEEQKHNVDIGLTKPWA